MSRKLSTASLGLHNKSSHQQSRHNLTTQWIATQGGQSNAGELVQGASTVSHEIVTPTITLTQPDESSSEVSEVLLPRLKVEAGPSHRGERQAQSSDLAEATREPPRKKWGWHYLSASNLVDEPIPEEEAEEEEEEEEMSGQKVGEEEGEEMKVTRVISSMKNPSCVIDEPILPSPASPRSSGGSMRRARAKSFPQVHYLRSQQMPELPTAEKEVQKDTTAAAVSVSPEKKPEDQQHLSPMFKFAQVAVMAKKWKLRSRDKSDDSHQSSREMLFNRQKRRPFVEVPYPLRLEILEEAHQIVTKTLQMYRSELGLRHKLTQQTEQHCETLAQQLGL